MHRRDACGISPTPVLSVVGHFVCGRRTGQCPRRVQAVSSTLFFFIALGYCLRQKILCLCKVSAADRNSSVTGGMVGGPLERSLCYSLLHLQKST